MGNEDLDAGARGKTWLVWCCVGYMLCSVVLLCIAVYWLKNKKQGEFTLTKFIIKAKSDNLRY